MVQDQLDKAANVAIGPTLVSMVLRAIVGHTGDIVNSPTCR